MESIEKRSHPSLCVVAHPDDEVLWFASILRRVDRVILVFGDHPEDPALGARRARAVARLPYQVSWLRIPEAGTYGARHWRSPECSDRGLVLHGTRGDSAIGAAYERNFHRIRQELERRITAGSTVFTHNPWGEYGHADHVQIYRILHDLRDDLSLDLKVSPYISSQSRPLAMRYRFLSPDDPEHRRIDSGYAVRIADIYKRHGCWTWAADWEWYESECMLDAPFRLRATESQPAVGELSMLLRIPSSVDERMSAPSAVG